MASTFATELFVKLFGVMPPERSSKLAPPKAPKTEVLVPNRPAEPGGKVIYHVTPRKDDRWNIRKEGGTRPSAVCTNKDEAIDRAREIAKNAGWSQVVVHNKDGKIAQEFNYGEMASQRTSQAAEEWEPDETDRGLEMTEIPTNHEKRPSAKIDKDHTPGRPTRVVWHVTPRAEDGKWRVKRQGSSKATRVVEKKVDAVKVAKELAKSRGKGQVVVHKQDGNIAESFKFDPE